MGLSLEDLGMTLEEDIAGVPSWEVRARGICVCGHRIEAHRGSRGVCHGVPVGRRTHAGQSEVDCGCAHMIPVIMVPDARPFRATWKSAMPAHPFTVALMKLGIERVEKWLVDTPLVCMNCGQVGGVRAAYWPGTHRTISGLFCQGEKCAPRENGD